MATLAWVKLHAGFLGNMSLGMYEYLAKKLGVSVDALTNLQVGYAPRVMFGGRGLKPEKVSFDGWFTFPMRDANAKITGMALRHSTSEVKVTFPGSKPGCFYVVNPDHKEGERGYSSGAHNWTRVGDGVVCPVCGKPDGCLVSSDDTSDPKAVICIREKSTKPMKLGWLHIRKEEGRLDGAPLAGSDKPVLVVEGASDVAAAFDLGFPAIGKPNNIGGQQIVAELVRGRTVIAMGENDRKANGEWPGSIGASMTLKACLTTTGKARILFPPEHIKDLRVWFTNYGLTADFLLDYADKNGQEQITDDLIPDDRPLTIFRRFLKEMHTAGKVTLLKNWEDAWYVYSEADGCYNLVEENRLIGEFARWTDDKQVIMERTKGPTPEKLKYTAGLWASMRQVALADGYLTGALPQWINGKSGCDMHNMICFNNGVLDVDAYLAGETAYLTPSTPDLFTVHALPFSFDPTAKSPRWLSFLESSLGDDPAKIALLQEWLGYCMTTDTSMEKMMYMRGPTGHGKGTILSMISHLVGERNVASPRFKKLAGQFGLQSLVGKLVCLIGDARDDRGGASLAEALEVLLSIVGRDALQVDRKFMSQIEGRSLACRITIASNVFLNIPDSAGAMERRLLLLDFQKKVTEDQRDYTLKDTLPQERAGIAVWALEGLRRMRLNGRFTEPASSKAAMQEWRTFNSPIASFIDECIHVDPAQKISRRMVYDAWEAWATAKRLGVGTRSQFFNDLLSAAPYARQESVGIGDRNEVYYTGMTLTPDAARRYLRKP